MSVALPLLVIIGLIALNGLFVAAEFALIGAPRATVERRAAEGHRVARLLTGILGDPRRQDQYVATAQLGITFASLGLGMYGEHVVAGWIAGWLAGLGPFARAAEHAVASVAAVALLTYLHIVLGEMVPKTLALQHAEGASMWTTPLMHWVRLLAYPLVLALNGIANLLLSMVGIRRTAVHQYHTPEELEMVIDESETAGALDRRSAKFVRELLRLRELTAGEIMVPRVRITALPLDATPERANSTLRQAGYSRYPVFESTLDNIVGFVHVKDLLPMLLDGRTLGRDLVRPVPFVPESMPADDLVDVMRAAETQMAVVMDEYGGTAGVITEKDVLDQLVGEIHEDAGQPQMRREPGGALHVPGTALLAEVGEELGLDLEHEEVDTVSGLVLSVLGRPPRPGDTVEYAGARFHVTAISGHGVAGARVEVPPAQLTPADRG